MNHRPKECSVREKPTLTEHVITLLNLEASLGDPFPLYRLLAPISGDLVDVDRGLFDPIILLEADVLSMILGVESLDSHRSRSLMIIFVQIEFIRKRIVKNAHRLATWELQVESRINFTTDPLQMRRLELIS
jgi:hypothetical protein